MAQGHAKITAVPDRSYLKKETKAPGELNSVSQRVRSQERTTFIFLGTPLFLKYLRDSIFVRPLLVVFEFWLLCDTAAAALAPCARQASTCQDGSSGAV